MSMNNLKRHLCEVVTATLRGGSEKTPESGRILWDVFQRLSATRTYHMGGPNPLQPSEILAFGQMMRLPLEPAHFDILMSMDRAWLDHAYAKSKVPEGVRALPPISKHPLSAGLLDAIMG